MFSPGCSTAKFCGRPDLQRVGNYIVAISADRQDFDKFRDSPFYKDTVGKKNLAVKKLWRIWRIDKNSPKIFSPTFKVITSAR